MRSLLLVLVLSTTVGCGSNNKDTEATTTERAPVAEGDRTTNAAHRKADDKATEDLQAQRAEEAKATEAKAAADADAVKANAVTHEQLQAKFDAADRRFNRLEEKVLKLTGTKRKKANAAVAVVKTHEATVMASIAKLREASLPQWDAAKAKVQSDSAALDKAIDELETTLQ